MALYRTVPAAPAEGLPEGDVVIVASPSAARVLAEIWEAPGAAPGAPRCVVVSIGPQTSAAARAAGLPVEVEAARFDLDGLVAAVQQAATLAAASEPRPAGSRAGEPAP